MCNYAVRYTHAVLLKTLTFPTFNTFATVESTIEEKSLLRDLPHGTDYVKLRRSLFLKIIATKCFNFTDISFKNSTLHSLNNYVSILCYYYEIVCSWLN